MPTTGISHALIVAGPSGAGKSTFLRDLAAGQLPREIMAELPEGAGRWHLICAGHPEQWAVLKREGEAGDRPEGIAVHYDVTSAWHFWHNRDFKQDPFWRLLQDCPAVTWVEVRPTKRRLIAQWCNAQLGTPHAYKIRLWNLCVSATHALLPLMRRLRRQTGSDAAPHWRYPRPLRFLKRLDLRLRSITRIPTLVLEYYRHPGSIEGLLDAWDKAASEIIGPRLVKRIDLAPGSRISFGRRASWHVKAVAACRPAAGTAALKPY